jgi:hypothetical protein
MARKFFDVCAGMFCLSPAFHFGYTTARAQAHVERDRQRSVE